jgi:hypothetical protein
MNPENPNPILQKLRRPDQLHKATGSARAFFGTNEKPQITRVTSDSIQYVDADGKTQIISFEDCMHCSSHERDFIGRRGLLSSPPWIEFFDKNHTRFEFESKKYALSILLNELTRLNIRTIDMD